MTAIRKSLISIILIVCTPLVILILLGVLNLQAPQVIKDQIERTLVDAGIPTKIDKVYIQWLTGRVRAENVQVIENEKKIVSLDTLQLNVSYLALFRLGLNVKDVIFENAIVELSANEIPDLDMDINATVEKMLLKDIEIDGDEYTVGAIVLKNAKVQAGKEIDVAFENLISQQVKYGKEIDVTGLIFTNLVAKYLLDQADVTNNKQKSSGALPIHVAANKLATTKLKYGEDLRLATLSLDSLSADIGEEDVADYLGATVGKVNFEGIVVGADDYSVNESTMAELKINSAHSTYAYVNFIRSGEIKYKDKADIRSIVAEVVAFGSKRINSPPRDEDTGAQIKVIKLKGITASENQQSIATAELDKILVRSNKKANLSLSSAKLEDIAIKNSENLGINNVILNSLDFHALITAKQKIDLPWSNLSSNSKENSPDVLKSIAINSLKLAKKSQLKFTDESLEKPFALGLDQLELEGKNVKIVNKEFIGNIKLNAKSNAFSALNIETAATKEKTQRQAEMMLKLVGLDLTTLSPYSEKLERFTINDGHADFYFDGKVDLSSMDGQALLNIIGLDMDVSKQKEGLNVAASGNKFLLGSSLALLADDKGALELKVPIKGKFDDPSVGVGKLMAQTVTKSVRSAFNLALKPLNSVLATPKFLIDLFSGENNQTVQFNTGSKDLIGVTKHELSKLTEGISIGLKEKRAIKVELCARLGEQEFDENARSSSEALDLNNGRLQAVKEYMIESKHNQEKLIAEPIFTECDDSEQKVADVPKVELKIMGDRQVKSTTSTANQQENR